ncbi:MAG: TlpA family protein disulfide reductase [Chitinophagaceae bacterium]|nr:TlpA family protein disulfide reductase [Chitinophagaceae bacterium]
MIEGKSYPVYFTPDSTVFSDPDFPKPTLGYLDLLNIRGNLTNTIEFKKGEIAKAIINYPTFFLQYDYFLVYPREHIGIKRVGVNDFTLYKINGNKRRNRELRFFKDFRKIDKYPIIPSLDDATLDTVLKFEENLKRDIPKYTMVSQLRFDSLIKAYRVSKKFKKIANSYLKNRYNIRLIFLYRSYKDTLQAHGLYKDKCTKLIPLFNNITIQQEFENIFLLLYEIMNVVAPYKISKINSELEFKSCFDFVLNSFNALAKDYLLSVLMYSANKNRIPISSNYFEKYNTFCYNITYKKLVNTIIAEQQQNDNQAALTSNNSLLWVDGKKVSGLEDILALYKGKLILIDFWASWCLPCREDIPYLKKIIQESPKDKIVFLSISIDKEIQAWRKFVLSSNSETDKNFLLINARESSFMQQFNINTIPRYMLINKDGTYISSDAPRPSEQALIELINKYLQ